MSDEKVYRIVLESVSDRVRASQQLRKLMPIPPEVVLRALKSLPLVLIETDNLETHKTWQEKIGESGSFIKCKEMIIEKGAENDKLWFATERFLGRGNRSFDQKYRFTPKPSAAAFREFDHKLQAERQAKVSDQATNQLIVKEARQLRIPGRFLWLSIGMIVSFGLAVLIKQEMISLCFSVTGLLFLLGLGLVMVPMITKGLNKIDEKDREFMISLLPKSCGACGRAVSKKAIQGDRCPHCGVKWDGMKVGVR